MSEVFALQCRAATAAPHPRVFALAARVPCSCDLPACCSRVALQHCSPCRTALITSLSGSMTRPMRAGHVGGPHRSPHRPAHLGSQSAFVTISAKSSRLTVRLRSAASTESWAGRSVLVVRLTAPLLPQRAPADRWSGSGRL